MKLIEPSVEYWQQEAGIQGVWKQIARAARVCYQSSLRKNETDEEFAKRVILKPALIEGDLNDLEHCLFDNLKLHGGVLEHGTVYLYLPLNYNRADFFEITESPYNKTAYDAANNALVTSNMRYIIENNKLDMLKEYGCAVPSSLHPKRYTFSVITDIGVTREFNRHRASMSICEESTRYCDYTKGKFGGELTFIRPAWRQKDKNGFILDFNAYDAALANAEQAYKQLRNLGWKPEQARQVLPLGLKTQAVYTAFEDDWRHFLKLRTDNVSGKVHPNIQYVANEIRRIAKENKL